MTSPQNNNQTTTKLKNNQKRYERMRETLGAIIITITGGCTGAQWYEKQEIKRNIKETSHEQERPEWMRAKSYKGPMFFTTSDERAKAISERKYVVYDSASRRLEIWPSARAQDATIYELDEKGKIIRTRYRIDGVEVKGVDELLRLRNQEEVEEILRMIAMF